MGQSSQGGISVENKSHLFRAFIGAAAFSLGLVACHGASSGQSSYVPTSSDVVTPQSGSGNALDNIAPDKRKHAPAIVSTCGDRVHIVVLGIVGCKFREAGYAGWFKIHNDTKGIIMITPKSGNSGTTFDIVGVAKGSGDFIVYSKNQSLVVHVRVLS
jgi:hypothetical protein